MKEPKKNKDESDFILNQGASSQAPSQELILQERGGEYYDLTNLQKDLEKPFKAIRKIKADVLKNQAETSRRINNLDDKISRKISNMHHIHDLAQNENRESIFKIKRLFKIIVYTWIVLSIVFAYFIFSKPQKMGAVEWPVYDHTKPYNPFSDKNPIGTVTVGDPTYDTGLIDNTASPTPFPGMYD